MLSSPARMAVQKEQFVVDGLTSLLQACCTKGFANKPTFGASLISTQQLRVPTHHQPAQAITRGWAAWDCRTASANVSSTDPVVARSMQASVMLWP